MKQRFMKRLAREISNSRGGLTFAALASLLAFAGCAGESPESTPSAETSPPEATEPVTRDPLIEIVELDPEEAAADAESIRREVSISLMDGFEVDLWASEQLLGDPVALDVDEKGRILATQTTRHQRSEFDIRGHPDWRIPSITWETVEDRRAFLHTELAPERSDENTWLADLNEDGSHDWRDLTVLKERVFQIEDTTGDGLADRSQLFYEGFNDEVADVAGGVVRYGDDVYVAASPSLWRLRDTTGDGWADLKESMVYGLGVHIGFSAHSPSGAIVGPDGRIYWSIGDYGANITTPDGDRLEYPNTGVILRANPDGSDVEVYASGLRNTHEFAFDEYGNVISVDNDGDHGGEHERIVYVFDGSDSGWRINWQFGKYGDPDNNSYKVWMDEELYRPHFDEQAAFILPPIAAFRSGPSGLAYNPGTALSDRWKNFVFVSEFVGAQPRSGITAFRLEGDGAGFDLAERHEVLRGLLATSLAFGPEGALYFTDWIEGWTMNGDGRIWKLDTPETVGSEVRNETQRLLEEDFADHSGDELVELLQHDDMRVRRKAQFALVNRGASGEAFLLEAVRRTEHEFARIHGLWGLGQLIRQGGDQAESVAAFLDDGAAEVRAQAAKVLGDVRYAGAGDRLIGLLEDEAPRVRFFATEALGRTAHEPAVPAIAEMLVRNDDQDLYLRHAGAIALARIGAAEPVTAYASHPSRALRIASVVALRRMREPGVAEFLSDEDPFVVTEAARAINDDRSIPEALPALARVLEEERFSGEPLLRRAINANLRLGGEEAAQRVADYATRGDAPEAMRVEALRTLAVWPRPSILDRVDGWHRGAVERDPATAREAVASVAESLLTGPASSRIRIAATETASRLGVESTDSVLVALLRDDESSDVRSAALNALQSMNSDRLPEAIAVALGDSDADVRTAALRHAPNLDTAGGQLVEMLAGVAETGSVPERQTALEALGGLGRDTRAREVLEEWLDRLLAGEVAPEIQLDLIEAAESHGTESLSEKLVEYRASQPAGALAEYAETLHGGDIDSGRRIFRNHPGASCTRCHAVDGRGGDAGPDLTEVGARANRERLLESLIEPNARITPGYGIVTLHLNDGGRITGVLREESESHLEMDVGGEIQRIDREAIVERNDAPSSMPSVRPVLTKQEIRHLLEYLASLQ